MFGTKVLFKTKNPAGAGFLSLIGSFYLFCGAGVASAVVTFLLPVSVDVLAALSPGVHSPEALADLSLHEAAQEDDDFLEAFSAFLVPSALGSLSLLMLAVYRLESPTIALRLSPPRANTNAKTDIATITFFILNWF
jgi:hypothetical protein